MLNEDCPKTLSMNDLLAYKKNRKNGRLPCNSSLTGSLIIPATSKTVDAWVLDLSLKGVGIMTSEKIDVGQDVIIKLKRAKAVSPISFPAHVLNCIMESGCCFRLGCQFEKPINSAMLEYLVG